MKNNCLFITCLTLLCISFGCNNSEKDHTVAAESSSLTRKMPHISGGGELVTFDENDSSRLILKTDTAEVKSLALTTTAPARIVVTMTPKENGMPSVPVFESQDLTQLYTDYTKSRNDLAHAEHELDRLKDLFSHNAITGK